MTAVSTRGIATGSIRKVLMFNLAVVWFVSYCDRVNMSIAVIPMQVEFGWNETTKGVVMASVFLGYLSSQIVGGWLTLRIGAVRLMGIAVLGYSAMTLLTPTAARHSLEALLIARVILGVFEGLAIPATYALVGRWSPAKERSRMLAIVLSGATLGAPGGLLMSGALVDTVGWRAMFYVFGAIGIVWVCVWLLRAHDNPEDHPAMRAEELALLAESRIPPRSHETLPLRRILSHPAVWAAAMSKFCMGWIVYTFLAWLPSYFTSVHGISLTGSGLLAALPWIVMTAMLHVASWQADRLVAAGRDITFVRKLMQSIGIGGALAFLLLVPAAKSVTMAVAFTCGASGLLAFCYSGVEPAMMEMAPRYRGFITGFVSTVGNLPGVIAIPAIGWMVDTTGSYAGGFIGAALIGVVGFISWLMFGTGRKVID
jgi:ACS family sodium-dependent inorganic phosphate cotransporter